MKIEDFRTAMVKLAISKQIMIDELHEQVYYENLGQLKNIAKVMENAIKTNYNTKNGFPTVANLINDSHTTPDYGGCNWKKSLPAPGQNLLSKEDFKKIIDEMKEKLK